MAFAYLNRRNVIFFSICALGGSYLIAKSGTVHAKNQQLQRKEGDFRVDTSRSGGGI